MSEFNSFSRHTSGNILVQRILGDAYHVVKETWDHLPNIQIVVNLYGQVQAELQDALNQIQGTKQTALLDLQQKWDQAVAAIALKEGESLASLDQRLASSMASFTALYDASVLTINSLVQLARDWAEKPVGKEVIPGHYSSKHYSEIAQQIVSTMSPLNWHPQILGNNVLIPDNTNAWSAGPEVTIIEGMTVTVGEGSYWTIM